MLGVCLCVPVASCFCDCMICVVFFFCFFVLHAGLSVCGLLCCVFGIHVVMFFFHVWLVSGVFLCFDLFLCLVNVCA